jgi:hypothetical protein
MYSPSARQAEQLPKLASSQKGLEYPYNNCLEESVMNQAGAVYGCGMSPPWPPDLVMPDEKASKYSAKEMEAFWPFRLQREHISGTLHKFSQ